MKDPAAEEMVDGKADHSQETEEEDNSPETEAAQDLGAVVGKGPGKEWLSRIETKPTVVGEETQPQAQVQLKLFTSAIFRTTMFINRKTFSKGAIKC